MDVEMASYCLRAKVCTCMSAAVRDSEVDLHAAA